MKKLMSVMVIVVFGLGLLALSTRVDALEQKKVKAVAKQEMDSVKRTTSKAMNQQDKDFLEYCIDNCKQNGSSDNICDSGVGATASSPLSRCCVRCTYDYGRGLAGKCPRCTPGPEPSPIDPIPQASAEKT